MTFRSCVVYSMWNFQNNEWKIQDDKKSMRKESLLKRLRGGEGSFGQLISAFMNKCDEQIRSSYYSQKLCRIWLLLNFNCYFYIYAPYFLTSCSSFSGYIYLLLVTYLKINKFVPRYTESHLHKFTELIIKCVLKCVPIWFPFLQSCAFSFFRFLL